MPKSDMENFEYYMHPETYRNAEFNLLTRWGFYNFTRLEDEIHE